MTDLKQSASQILAHWDEQNMTALRVQMELLRHAVEQPPSDTRKAMEKALDALIEIQRVLDDANAQPGGPIADTIWRNEHETLFDYIASEIESLRSALAQPDGWKKECEDTDKLLVHLGLDPDLCRTDGGWLNLQRIKETLNLPRIKQALEQQQPVEATNDLAEYLSWAFCITKSHAHDLMRLALAQQEQHPVAYVPVDSKLRDANWNHPNDTEKCDPQCQEALDARGDDKEQGLDGYWKWGFKAGWNAALAQQGEQQPTFIEVRAEVRYWEDSSVNGVEDEVGTLIPLRNGKYWAPVIRLEDGTIMDWPQGTTADVHFKVCDHGEYWLLDGKRNRIAKWGGDYVPNQFLCHGDNGYGDYIIFKVIENGRIEGWRKPTVNSEQWPDFEPLYAGAAPAAQPVHTQKLPEFCTCEESHPMECDGCRANREAAQPVQGEPVMIYHGRCTIDCGDHGHHDVEMLKLIPAGTKLYTAAPSTPQPDARKVIEQMVTGLSGFVDELSSDQLDEIGMWSEYESASLAREAGQQWLKEHK